MLVLLQSSVSFFFFCYVTSLTLDITISLCFLFLFCVAFISFIAISVNKKNAKFRLVLAIHTTNISSKKSNGKTITCCE